MGATPWDLVAKAIGEATGEPFTPRIWYGLPPTPLDRCAVLQDGERFFFVKRDKPSARIRFECEAESLRALDATGAIRVPKVITVGATRGRSYIVLERILMHLDTRESDALLGQRLAAVHRHSAPEFGWGRDNFIGSMPQCNRRYARWADFFRECRLRPQLERAHQNGLPADHSSRLIDAADRILADHNPPPALVHGDLWSGNRGVDYDRQPFVFDPCVHYADRETELALPLMFRGFHDSFFTAYVEAWPLADGYEYRLPLYQLYHYLNHFNLFGGGYADDCLAIMRMLTR